MAPERRRGERKSARAQALAAELGVDAVRVGQALAEVRKGVRAGEIERREVRGELARALGVSEQRLRQAFGALRGSARTDRRERSDAFVAALAAELGIAEAKVRAALAQRLKGGHGRRDAGRAPAHRS